MAYTAPPPVLNDTAPQVNLMQQWFPYGGTNTAPAQSATAPSSGTAPATQASAMPNIDLSGAVPVIFSLVFVIWAIYTFVVIYHWFRYRHKSWFAVPMIVVHLFISGSIILFMISGLK
jgi:tellurite resistance protein TehA-like permease